MRLGRVILAAVLLVIGALGAVAETTTSANARAAVGPAVAVTPSGPYEQAPIRRSGGTGNPAAASQPTRSGTLPNGGWDLGKVPLALGGVIALILVMRWFGKGFLPGSRQAKGSRAVQVLVRSPVGPKQQLMLVQVGRRLVLVGNGGAQMNSLCEIDEPDEVAELLGTIRGEKAARPGSFGAMFGRAEKAYDGDGVEEEPEEPERESGTDLSGLMERVKRISEQFQES